jgi:membrane protease YdiL (CAAX protease family)
MKNFKTIINWKMFFILLVACGIGSILVLPYALSLTSTDIELPFPIQQELVIPLFVIISTVQNLIMFAIVIFLGLLLSQKIGMGLPILEGVLKKENKAKEFKAILLPSIGLGVLAGVLIILISIPFNNAIPEFKNFDPIPAWKGFLASFYGGIAEEVLLRLFLMSLFVWIIFKIKKTKDGGPTVFGIWLSIVLAAVVFGLGHLPATAQILPLTGLVVFRAILLNGIGGVIFGWLYWKKGLESAIIAHFSADIVLHVITPIVVSFFSS